MLYDELRSLRRENAELKLEKWCSIVLVCAFLLFGIVHFAFEHAAL